MVEEAGPITRVVEEQQVAGSAAPPSGTGVTAAAWSLATRGSVIPVAWNHTYLVKLEQSKPTVDAPLPNPSPGPLNVPPPHEYGMPSWVRATSTTFEPSTAADAGRARRAAMLGVPAS